MSHQQTKWTCVALQAHSHSDPFTCIFPAQLGNSQGATAEKQALGANSPVWTCKCTYCFPTPGSPLAAVACQTGRSWLGAPSRCAPLVHIANHFVRLPAWGLRPGCLTCTALPLSKNKNMTGWLTDLAAEKHVDGAMHTMPGFSRW